MIVRKLENIIVSGGRQRGNVQTQQYSGRTSGTSAGGGMVRRRKIPGFLHQSSFIEAVNLIGNTALSVHSQHIAVVDVKRINTQEYFFSNLFTAQPLPNQLNDFKFTL